MDRQTYEYFMELTLVSDRRETISKLMCPLKFKNPLQKGEKVGVEIMIPLERMPKDPCNEYTWIRVPLGEVDKITHYSMTTDPIFGGESKSIVKLVREVDEEEFVRASEFIKEYEKCSAYAINHTEFWTSYFKDKGTARSPEWEYDKKYPEIERRSKLKKQKKVTKEGKQKFQVLVGKTHKTTPRLD